MAKKALVRLSELPPIVFSSNRLGRYALYAANAEGGGMVRAAKQEAMYPAWSPDGTRLVFVRDATSFASRRVALGVIEQDGSIRLILSRSQIPSHPTLRPPGNSVTYQSKIESKIDPSTLGLAGSQTVSNSSRIDDVSIASGRSRTIVEHRGAAYQPTWSPDGRALAFVAGQGSCDAARGCRQRLHLWREGGAVLRTLVGRGSVSAPAWSPDGTRLAFTWDRGGGGGGRGVWTLHVRDGRLHRVGGGFPGASEPTWSPDGERLAFSRGCDIHVVQVDSGAARNITRSPRICEISPAWRPRPAR